MSFAKVKDVTEMPNLIEVQLDSYEWFLKEGLLEVFDDINPISNFTGNLVLEFVDYKLDMDNIKYSVEECKERDSTYAAPLKVSVRLTNNDTGEIKEQEVFMGDFPLMTEQGTFIINGAERVVVSQLVRSPGVYYSYSRDKSGKKLFASTVIPNRGAWLEYETDSNDVIYVRIDKTRKLPISILARAMGYGSDQELLEYFGEEERFKATIEKDNTKTREEALLEIYKRLRPGEPPTVDSAVSLIDSLFFDAKRYDLSRVGRYKFNRKLAINLRLINQIAAVDVINPSTGEVMVEQGEKISREMAEAIQCAGINSVDVLVEDRVVRVIGNYFVDINKDGKIDEADKTIIGNPNPDIYGNIFGSVMWKNFTLTLGLNYSLGNDVYNYSRSVLESGSNFYNQTIAMANRWRHEGQVTDMPRLSYGDPMGNARFSDRWIEDGSYLRLKTVNISYKVPVKGDWIQGLTIWAEANNLFTITKYLGSDPEFSAANGVLYQGIDPGNVALSRTFTFGMKINL